MHNKTIWISITILFAGVLSVVTAAANPALIVAASQLNLPAAGTINVVLSSKPDTPTERINLFEYGTLSNYDPERWAVTLPPSLAGGEVLHDTAASQLYLSYRIIVGTMILVR